MKKEKAPAKRILIVEDNRDLCFILELLLGKDNVLVDHVKSLSDARGHLEEEKADLVVLDNRLPDGLGLDFIPFIKNTYPEARIMMISGQDNAASDIALESGADLFLSKPFTRDQLEKSVKSLLN
ncbi:MAG: response regulator [Chitinophagaceae bacterium]